MSAHLSIDERQGVVFTRLTGVLRAVDLWEHRKDILAHSAFKPHFHQWIDMREVTSFDLSADEVARFAGGSVFSTTSRRVFIVNSTLEYGLSRMFETFAAGEFLICRDPQEANRFLGIGDC